MLSFVIGIIPPSFTTGHRPGTARVDGDRVVLLRTTIEEVEQTHRTTLKLVVDETNKEIDSIVRRRAADEKAKKQADDAERDRFRKQAADMDFT